MKREFAKNSSLRLASRFFGIFAADSLIVNNEYNLLTSALCISCKITQSHPEVKTDVSLEKIIAG